MKTSTKMMIGLAVAAFFYFRSKGSVGAVGSLQMRARKRRMSLTNTIHPTNAPVLNNTVPGRPFQRPTQVEGQVLNRAIRTDWTGMANGTAEPGQVELEQTNGTTQGYSLAPLDNDGNVVVRPQPLNPAMLNISRRRGRPGRVDIVPATRATVNSYTEPGDPTYGQAEVDDGDEQSAYDIVTGDIDTSDD